MYISQLKAGQLFENLIRKEGQFRKYDNFLLLLIAPPVFKSLSRALAESSTAVQYICFYELWAIYYINDCLSNYLVSYTKIGYGILGNQNPTAWDEWLNTTLFRATLFFCLVNVPGLCWHRPGKWKMNHIFITCIQIRIEWDMSHLWYILFSKNHQFLKCANVRNHQKMAKKIWRKSFKLRF